ncbi:MAG: Rne/Rng family ribonuclease [SAR324 cluster bacterium]|nr:Rne/Rng family ribonuclease [SAR324 cluster bacterium]
MGSKNMLVNVQEDETRIALTENNRLVDLHIELTDRERTVSNIYKGVVVKVNPAFQAAFIDYGEARNGFLSISDIDPSLYKGEGAQRGRPKIQSILKSGQTLMVQVLKEGIREKGAALTTTVSLPGRYLVLTTNSERSGVSRKIEDADKRVELKNLLAGLKSDKQGAIIRTAGIDRSPTELKRDLANLQKEWKSIESKFQKQKKPGLLYQEPKSLLRVLRDYFSDDVEDVLVDSADAFQEALLYFKAVLPKFQKRLKLYVGDKSLFSANNIEVQIGALDSSKVSLPSGGGLVIEPTEALVTIDVNSGKSNKASDIEVTALNTNLEAAAEAGRQLRLRNLGGLIVIDFIDMMQAKNRANVEKALAEAMKDDKARISIGNISEFGLLELSRQRIDVELSRGSRIRCEACGGTGHVPTANSSANNVLRELREMAASGKYTAIHGELPLDHANFLLNHRRESLRDLELEFEIEVHITGNPTLPAGQSIRLHGKQGAAEEPAEGETVEAASATGAEAQSADEAGSGGRPRRRRRRRSRRNGQEETTEVAASGEQPGEEEEQPGEEEEQLPVGEQELEQAAEREPYAAPPVPGNGGSPHPNNGEGQTAPPAPANAEGVPGRVPLRVGKRGDWMARMNSDDIAIGDTLFTSSHQTAQAGPAPILTSSFKRSGPFLGVEAEDSTTLFDSKSLSAGDSVSDEPAAKSKTSRGKGRAKAGAGKSKKTGAAKGKSGASRGGRGRARKTEG